MTLWALGAMTTSAAWGASADDLAAAAAQLADGRPATALRSLGALDPYAPHAAYAAYLRGRAMEAMNQPDLAVAAYTDALKLRPSVDPKLAVPRATVEAAMLRLQQAATKLASIADPVQRRCGEHAPFCTAVLDLVDDGTVFLNEWQTADLDGDGRPERVADLCAGRRQQLVIEDEGALFLVKGAQYLCSASMTPWRGKSDLPPLLQTLEPTVTIEDSYHSWSEQTRVGMRDGRPVTLWSTDEGHSMMGGTENTTDYVEGREEGRSVYEEAVRWSRGLVPIGGPAAPAPARPTPNWTTFGRAAWAGPSDAAVSATGTRADGRIVLDISVTDDHLDLASGTPDARLLMQHDHVELWWCTARDCHLADKSKSLPIVRQVAVGVATDGTAFARWLHQGVSSGGPTPGVPSGGATDPLPTVTGTPTAMRVTFDLAALGAAAGAEALDVPFTVVYSDSDGPDVGQQTLVATSDLVWGLAVSFGRLVHPPFPPLGQRIDGWPAMRLALRP